LSSQHPAPSRLAPSRRVDLVVHAGSGKTGTSSIQALLHRNRKRLARRGILFPQVPGRRRHLGLNLYMLDPAPDDVPEWRRRFFRSAEDFERRLFDEIDESGLTRVLISDEAVYGSPHRALDRLRGLTDRLARSVRLVVYLRRQDDHLASRYQQVVKIGETRRLRQRMQEIVLENTYDYYNRLSILRRKLEPTELVVRRFERSRFVHGSLYQDFLDATDLGVREDELRHVQIQNESLDAESVEFLRIVNLLREERPDVAPAVGDNHSLVPLLAAVSTGVVLTLPEDQLDAFMSRWEEPNRKVALEFIGDPSGELFELPRRARGVTHEQRLDPDRLDHFLATTKLPDEVHRPLRSLVEREALTP